MEDLAVVTALSPAYALRDLLYLIMECGNEITVRGSTTKEIEDVTIRIQQPMERCYIMPERNDNIFAKIAESLWVMSGRNDAIWLQHYLPRALDFSDDGRTWRAAYGKRIRDWSDSGPTAVDQLVNAVRLLREDPSTRRAVIDIWDPWTDYTKTKDTPCNNWLHFLVRDRFDEGTEVVTSRLNMAVAQRSSDAIWGFSGINTFEWSILQMMMAYWTGTVPGYLTYFISSSHVYSRHYHKADAIIKAFQGCTVYDYGVLPASGFCTSLEHFDAVMSKFWELENLSRSHDLSRLVQSPLDPDISIHDPFLLNCLKMLNLYNRLLEPGIDWDLVRHLVAYLPNNDFKVAAVHWIMHNHPDMASIVEYLDEPTTIAYEYVMSGVDQAVDGEGEERKGTIG